MTTADQVDALLAEIARIHYNGCPNCQGQDRLTRYYSTNRERITAIECRRCQITWDSRPPAQTLRGNCQHDWQGPSEMGASDDLLVISCQCPEQHNGPHYGVLDAITSTPGVIVTWGTVGGILYNLRGERVR